MEFIFALIAALSLSSIPLILGWRRSSSEEETARVLGIAARGKKFDPEKFALQTGTGLTFNQIAIGFGAWVGGGFFAGMAFGGSKMAGMAIIGIVSLVILVLVAFLILPELGDVLKNNTPKVPWDMGSGSFFIPLNLLRFRRKSIL